MTRFQHCITLEGPAIGAGNHRMGFTPPSSPIVTSAEEFIFTTPNIVAKKSKLNALKNEPKSNQEQNHNRHITSY